MIFSKKRVTGQSELSLAALVPNLWFTNFPKVNQLNFYELRNNPFPEIYIFGLEEPLITKML